MAINTLMFGDDLCSLDRWLSDTERIQFDAVIVSDPGAMTMVRQQRPGLPIHVSTQASTSNAAAAAFWKKAGASRVILSRECTLSHAREIAGTSGVDVEIFIHGAMCVSISGRCFLSQFLFGKSANRGECIQPCRREYVVADTEREFTLSIGNNYILSPKDLCALPFVPRSNTVTIHRCE